MSDEPLLLTAPEVARMLRVSTDWVYEHADALNPVRLGGGPRPRLRFTPAGIDRYIAGRGHAAQDPTEPTSLTPTPAGRRKR